VDIYVICDNIQKKKEIGRRRAKPSNSAFWIFSWENSFAWELFTEGMDLSLTTPNKLSALTIKNLPFPRFGHEQKNTKIASESSYIVTYQCFYCDGRENHPRRGFSTEATASYSHWRGLLELTSKQSKMILHYRQQHVEGDRLNNSQQV
jgi:hypothetical protein